MKLKVSCSFVRVTFKYSYGDGSDRSWSLVTELSAVPERWVLFPGTAVQAGVGTSP